ncbi:MAG: hypothetical protein IIZ40_02570 [Bacilli bacterium]|nr:hypothetical protein [Bacilli bacterium]
MKKNKKLLLTYLFSIYDKIKNNYPFLAQQIDINSLKDEIITSNKGTHELKSKIDEIYMDELSNYLDKKREVALVNPYFEEKEYKKFTYDYDLCKYLLIQTNNKIQLCEYEMPKLINELSIDDCKNIVYDFFKELYKDDDYVMDNVKNILFNNVNIFYENIRSYSNKATKEIFIEYSNDLSFLLTLVHELGHMISSINDNKLSRTDARLIEIESSIMEKLFLKYLKSKELKILKDSNSKKRSLNQNDLDNYLIMNYAFLSFLADDIVSEYNFYNVLKDGKFKKDSLKEYMSESKKNYLKAFGDINYTLNKYIPFSLRNEEINKLELTSLDDDILEKIELNSMYVNIRYISSYLIAFFYGDLIKNEEVVDVFKTYLKDHSNYSYKYFTKMLTVNLDEVFSLSTLFIEKYKKILKKKGYKLETNLYFVDKDIKEDIDICKKRKKYILENPWYLKLFNDLLKLGNITNEKDIEIDGDPNKIIYQMDDWEKDEYIDTMDRVKKIMKLYIKENE